MIIQVDKVIPVDDVVAANVLVVPCSISVNAIRVADAGFISVWLFVDVIPVHEYTLVGVIKVV